METRKREKKKQAALHGFFNLDELKNAVLHLLDGLEFGQAHTALVGNVIDTADRFGVFAGSATYLEIVLGGNLFELLTIGGQFGQFNVHRCTDGGSQV